MFYMILGLLFSIVAEGFKLMVMNSLTTLSIASVAAIAFMILGSYKMNKDEKDI